MLILFFRLFLLLLVLVGHGGFWVWLYNRVNATGYPRKHMKRVEKCVVAVCLILPWLFLGWECLAAYRWPNWQIPLGGIDSPPWLPPLTACTIGYGIAALIFLLWIGPQWLLHRPQFQFAHARYRMERTELAKDLHHDNPHWVVGEETRRMLRMPGNQILSVENNVKHVMLDRLDPQMRGLRIGHLSDIHLTGELAPDFQRQCVDWVASQNIDVLVVSGDIVDYEHALDDLEKVFGHLDSSLPKVFVLGNHDRAHGLVVPVRDRMVAMGWLDAGEHTHWIETRCGWMHVCGNERPWLHRQLGGRAQVYSPSASRVTAPDPSAPHLRLGVSHSPDQFAWGREQQCQLLLCGHTHGGQVRFPWIGPVIAPSWHGSRYASGVFYQAPTLMHVSRGLSGVHPFRFRCVPEASVLVLEPYET